MHYHNLMFLFLPSSPFLVNDTLTAKHYVADFFFFNENPYSKIYVSSTELSEDFKNQKCEKPHVFQIRLGDGGTFISS